MNRQSSDAATVVGRNQRPVFQGHPCGRGGEEGIAEERPLRGDAAHVFVEGHDRALELHQLAERRLLTFERAAEVRVRLRFRVLQRSRAMAHRGVFQVEIYLGRELAGLCTRRHIRRENHLDHGRHRQCAKDQLAHFEKQESHFRALRIEHGPKASLRILHVFAFRSDLRQRRSIEPRAAIVTINSLGLVFAPALRTNQRDHSAVCFFGFGSAFAGDAAAGGALPSFAAAGLSAVAGAAGASFFAASRYESLR